MRGPTQQPAPRQEPARRNSIASYVVRADDSLWAIAARLLGPAASKAEIASEVNRIWELNKHRIRSGHPNLIGVGERLTLR